MNYDVQLLYFNQNTITLEKQYDFNVCEVLLVNRDSCIPVSFSQNENNLTLDVKFHQLEIIREYRILINGIEINLTNDNFYEAKNIEGGAVAIVTIRDNKLSLIVSRSDLHLLDQAKLVEDNDINVEIHTKEHQLILNIEPFSKNLYPALTFRNQFIAIPFTAKADCIILDHKMLESLKLPVGEFQFCLMKHIVDKNYIAYSINTKLNSRLIINSNLFCESHNSKLVLINTSSDEEIIRGKLVVEHSFCNDNEILIDVSNSCLPEEYEICLINESDISDQYPLEHDYTGNFIKIDLKSFANINKNIEGQWAVCLKHKYKNYILIDSCTIDASLGERKVIKRFDSYKVEDRTFYSEIYINGEALTLCQLPVSKYINNIKRQRIEQDIYIQNITIDSSYIEFRMMDIPLDENTIIQIVLVSRSTFNRIIYTGTVKDGLISVKTSNWNDFENIANERFDLYAKVITTNFLYEGRLFHNDEVKSKKGLSLIQLNNEESILIYRTSGNKLSIAKGRADTLFKEKNQITTKLIDLKKVSKDQYNIVIDILAVEKIKIDAVCLKLRSKTNMRTITSNEIKISNNKGGYKINAEFSINWDEFFPLYWDIFVKASDKDEHFGHVRVNGSTNEIINKVNKDYFKYAIKSKDKSKIIYPYVTFDGDISFMMRERESYETYLNKFKELIAYSLYLLLKPLFSRKRTIWLGFEKFSKTAQDNGYAFFSYVDKNKLHEDFYFIIDKHSPDFKRISQESKNIVPFMSIKYFFLLFASKLLISSETKRHVHNIRIRSGRVARTINNKKSVFLQHGVTALKRSDVFKKAKGRGNFDLVVATSDIEREIINENWNYSNEEIAVTGFARWDLLKDKSMNRKKKKIFIMPTWRTWMEDIPKEEFIKSDYYQNYYSLLTSKELERMLVENDLEVVFFLHPKFKQYASEFKNELDSNYIKVKEFLEVKVNEEIMESSLMISDYSSVTWDMFYLKKPIIFYQFDLEKYIEFEGSYIDMDSDLFGDRAKNLDEVLTSLKTYINRDFKLKDKYRVMHNNYFKYTDNENSKRIYQEIKSRIK